MKKHWVKFGITLFLILIEAGLVLLFPLFIGHAVDDALNATYDGACFDDGDFDYVMMYRSTMRSHSLTTLIFLGSNSHFSFVMWNYLGG